LQVPATVVADVRCNSRRAGGVNVNKLPTAGVLLNALYHFSCEIGF
jgi:hypothetical protein